MEESNIKRVQESPRSSASDILPIKSIPHKTDSMDRMRRQHTMKQKADKIKLQMEDSVVLPLRMLHSSDMWELRGEGWSQLDR